VDEKLMKMKSYSKFFIWKIALGILILGIGFLFFGFYSNRYEINVTTGEMRRIHEFSFGVQVLVSVESPFDERHDAHRLDKWVAFAGWSPSATSCFTYGSLQTQVRGMQTFRDANISKETKDVLSRFWLLIWNETEQLDAGNIVKYGDAFCNELSETFLRRGALSSEEVKACFEKIMNEYRKDSHR
jgi:hypothetical protein